MYEAIQKLRNSQRGGGGRIFCHISLPTFEEEGGILRKGFVTASSKLRK